MEQQLSGRAKFDRELSLLSRMEDRRKYNRKVERVVDEDALQAEREKHRLRVMNHKRRCRGLPPHACLPPTRAERAAERVLKVVCTNPNRTRDVTDPEPVFVRDAETQTRTEKGFSISKAPIYLARVKWLERASLIPHVKRGGE